MIDLKSSLLNIQSLLESGHIEAVQSLLDGMIRHCRKMNVEVHLPNYKTKDPEFEQRCKKEAAMRIGVLLYESGAIDMSTTLSEHYDGKCILAQLQIYNDDR